MPKELKSLKLPKKINVGYKTFKVVQDKDFYSKTGNLADINHRTFVINIQTPKAGEWEPSFVLETLAHEFAHAYYLEHDNSVNTEANADRFASMFMYMAKNLGWIE